MCGILRGRSVVSVVVVVYFPDINARHKFERRTDHLFCPSPFHLPSSLHITTGIHTQRNRYSTNAAMEALTAGMAALKANLNHTGTAASASNSTNTPAPAPVLATTATVTNAPIVDSNDQGTVPVRTTPSSAVVYATAGPVLGNSSASSGSSAISAFRPSVSMSTYGPTTPAYSSDMALFVPTTPIYPPVSHGYNPVSNVFKTKMPTSTLEAYISANDTSTAPWIPKIPELTDKKQYTGKCIDIFPCGDMYIELSSFSDEGTSTTRYLVGSQVLCSTSRVFTKMYGPDSPYGERKRLDGVFIKKEDDENDYDVYNGKPVYKYEEEDPEMFATLLKLLHHHSEVQRKLNFASMLFFTILADKYELTTALKLWSEEFIRSFNAERKKIENAILMPGEEDWLFVAWVWGLDDDFKRLSMSLIRRAALVDGELEFKMSFGSKTWVLTDAVPVAVYGKFSYFP